MSQPDFGNYTEHRTGVQIHRLLHYGHVIPASRGFTARHLEQNYPGWTWSQLVGICRAAGIVLGSSAGGPPQCHPLVKAIHFDRDGSWAVEWLGGPCTSSDDEIDWDQALRLLRDRPEW